MTQFACERAGSSELGFGWQPSEFGGKHVAVIQCVEALGHPRELTEPPLTLELLLSVMKLSIFNLSNFNLLFIVFYFNYSAVIYLFY